MLFVDVWIYEKHSLISQTTNLLQLTKKQPQHCLPLLDFGASRGSEKGLELGGKGFTAEVLGDDLSGGGIDEVVPGDAVHAVAGPDR